MENRPGLCEWWLAQSNIDQSQNIEVGGAEIKQVARVPKLMHKILQLLCVESTLWVSGVCIFCFMFLGNACPGHEEL